MSKNDSGIPFLGVGVNYRHEILKDLQAHPEQIDFIEIISEKLYGEYVDEGISFLTERMPVVCHGLDLSIGTAAALDAKYLNNLEKVINRLKPIWFSDHIAYTNAGEVHTDQLMPVQFSLENAKYIIKKIQTIQKTFDLPFLLENITYYFKFPKSYLKEIEFINYIVEHTGCYLLLDLNNLLMNSLNHHYDALEFINKIYLEKVIEIHLAGGEFRSGFHIDSHSQAITDKVWNFLEIITAMKDCCIKGVIIERDKNLENCAEIFDEVKKAQNIIQEINQKSNNSIQSCHSKEEIL